MDNQEQIPAQNSHSGKMVIITILYCILTGIIVGTAVYFWQSNSATQKDAALQEKESVSEKNKEIAVSESAVNPNIIAPAPGEIAKPTERNIDPKTCPPGLKTPVVHFVPGGLFTEAEKTEIKKEIVDPYSDYMKDSQQEEPVVIAINKYSDADRAQKGYYYNIDSYGTSVVAGWLERKSNENIDWWIPDCMGICQFSASYRQQYPEVFAKYNAQ